MGVGWWGWWKRLPGAGGREEPAPPGLVAGVNKHHPEPVILTAPGGGRDEGAHGLWQRAPLS